jgi:hypothetical protein
VPYSILLLGVFISDELIVEELGRVGHDVGRRCNEGRKLGGRGSGVIGIFLVWEWRAVQCGRCRSEGGSRGDRDSSNDLRSNFDA